MATKTLTLAAALACAVLLGGAPPVAAAADHAGAGAGGAATEAARHTALTAHVVLKVVHPEQARRELLAEVEKLGGFAVLVSDTELRVKVPPAHIGDTLDAVTRRGLVVEKSLAREDLTQSIAQLEGRLRSKQDIFVRLRRFIDDSDVAATLQIERQMTALVSEVEQVGGQLRVERERTRWALVTVAFQFRERDRIVYVRSPFQWLNSVDLNRFLGEF
jgi:hypothetical protein